MSIASHFLPTRISMGKGSLADLYCSFSIHYRLAPAHLARQLQLCAA